MTLGQQIRVARKKLNLTHQQLANRCELALSTIQSMESDSFEPSLKSLLKVVRTLRCKVEFEEHGEKVQLRFLSSEHKYRVGAYRGEE